MAELGLGEEWIGKGNLEVQTGPVLHLRETATKMGLLRKHGGMLLVTSRGALCVAIRLAYGDTWRTGRRIWNARRWRRSWTTACAVPELA